MMEVMIVALMVLGTVMAVSSIQSGSERSNQPQVRGHHERAEDVLALQGLPATNTSVHFTHRLEELIAGNLTDGDDTLARAVRAHYAADHRLLLQYGEKEHLILGPQTLPVDDVPDGSSAMWHSRLGQTLVRPLVSHQDDAMDVWFQLLPAWADRVSRPAGGPMQVTVDLDGDQDWNLSEVRHHRLPLSGQHPLDMVPQSTGGADQWVVQESAVTNGTKYEWDLRLRLAPTDPDRIWLAQGEVFELLPPSSSWSLGSTETDWKDVSGDDDPVVSLEYEGPPRRGEGEAWLNASLHRPVSDGLTGIETLRVRTKSHLGGEVNVVLTPSQVERPGPVALVVSQPTPIPVNQVLPLTFTLTNPTDEILQVERFAVDFEAGHQFKHESSDWSRTKTGGRVVYEYTGSAVSVPAGGATTVALPVKVQNELEGNNVRRDRPPVLEYLGEGRLQPPHRDGYLSSSGEDDVPRALGIEQGDRVFVAALAGDARENGTHTVRVGHFADDLVPPGVGTYTRLNDSSGGFFPQLLETRFTMAMDHPSSLQPEEPLGLTLDLAGLRSLLDGFGDELSGDPVRFEVRAGDLLETVAGRPEAVHKESFDLLDLEDGMELEAELEFARSASMGPVVVDAKIVIPTLEHGEVELHFMSHAMRAGGGEAVVPVFMKAHLQYWVAGLAESTQ